MTITVKNRAHAPIQIIYPGKTTFLWDKFEINAEHVGLTFTMKHYQRIRSLRLNVDLKFTLTCALKVGRYAIDEKGLFNAATKSDEVEYLHQWKVSKAKVR